MTRALVMCGCGNDLKSRVKRYYELRMPIEISTHGFEERSPTAPTPNVTIGAWVKVGLCNERFWCRARAFQPNGTLLGTVANDLVNTALRDGDAIVVQLNHVLEVATMNEFMQFNALVASHSGSETAAAMAWYGARASMGAGVKARPGAVLLAAGQKGVKGDN